MLILTIKFILCLRAIAGMRNQLIHDYFDVDLETVWQTAVKVTVKKQLADFEIVIS
jgi:uncharacterized protein with HEPN domain